MRRHNFFLIILVASGFFVGCAHQINLRTGKNIISKEGLIEIEGLWLKDEGDTFDMGIRVTNKATAPIMFPRADMTCKKGTDKGIVDKTSQDESNGRFWVLEPEESKQFYYVCLLDQKNSDHNFQFIIRKIYENKTGDGATRGELLGENIVLNAEY